MDLAFAAQDGHCVCRFDAEGLLCELAIRLGPCEATVPVVAGVSRAEVLANCNRIRNSQQVTGDWQWESVEHDVHFKLSVHLGEGRLSVRCEPQWQSDSQAMLS